MVLAAVAGIFLLAFSVRVPETLRLLSPLPSLHHSGLNLTSGEAEVLNTMLEYAPQTNWIITDQLMFAFRLRLPTPPNLAVFTHKRMETGELTEEEIIESIAEWSPEQVLLARDPYPRVHAFLQQEYELIHASDQLMLYVKRDVLG